MAGAGIGMMDPAYFVGRREIVGWLNTTFAMNLAKIEETANGAVAVQILDSIYPGEVPMSKVRWDAKSSHEFIDNYKIIQSVFEKKGIDKHIEVEKLMRAKYQDNLENMQWFKSFFGKNYAGQPYDPIGRRAKGKGADSVAAFALDPEKRGKPHVDAGTDEPATARAVAPRAAPANSARKSTGAAEQSKRAATAVPVTGAVLERQARTAAPVQSAGPGSRASGASASAAGVGSGRTAELMQQVDDLRLSVESLEKERDFYFGKLRDIEVLLQGYSGPDAALPEQLFKILYAADEDFVPVDPETGQPVVNA